MTTNTIVSVKAIEEAVAATKAQIEGFVAQQKAQLEQAQAKLTVSVQDLAAFSKENVEAVVASGTIAAKGAEEVGKEVAAYVQSSAEAAAANGKALFSVKSVEELVALQQTLVQQSYQAFVTKSQQLQALSQKVANDALAPLGARVNAAVEKFSKPLVA